MNRRTFLQTGLAITTLGAISSATLAAESSAKRIKIGFLGGSHSHAMEKVKTVKASADYELVGIVEEDAKLRAQYQKLGVPILSADALLGLCGVVAVESGVSDHAKHAMLALKAGKHVHVEKPPAETVEGLRELQAVAAEKRLLLQMGYMWRFNPGINAALEAARKGWLGQVYQVRGTINTQIAGDRRPDLARFKGGMLFELGCHLIDPLVRLLGRPEKVTSFLNKSSDFQDNLADNALAVFEFAKATAIIGSSSLQPGAGAHRTFEILGTNGTATVCPIEPPSFQIDLAKPAGPYKAGVQTVALPKYQRYVPELAELAACVRSGNPLSVTQEEDLLVQETLVRACQG
jgi:predicted dehydrogenase